MTKEWGGKVARVRLNHAAADYCLRSVVYRKLNPLAATTMTEEQCTLIIKPLLATGLQAVGIMQNFPYMVIHRPYNWQGLQFPNLHTEQMVQ